LLEWLEWLENTGVARMVQESSWGYPIILSTHAVGMAILAGIILMINFRIMGLASGLPLTSFRPMYRLALFGLLINAVSGTLLFVANPDAFFESNPFRIKVILLIVGITMMLRMGRRVFGSGVSADTAAAVAPSKLAALISTMVWLGVIISGRLIAYIDWKDF